jgi:AAA+ ATPase superfamily predicted ATPase
MSVKPVAPAFVLVGRKAEQEELTHALESGRPELIALYGRRRVGKTYLIRTIFAKQLCFELTGIRDASQAHQLREFARRMEEITKYKHQTPTDWAEAFRELTKYLRKQLRFRIRKVVFFDELPWLASRRSGFLSAFDHFWNSWASQQSSLIVVICGSAASWMISKVLHHKGGLHNRVTRSMALQPFRLHDAEVFLRARGIELDRKQIIETYMAVGGIPYYLDYVRKGRSAGQNIDAMCFAPNAPLRDEFDQLFAALFEHPDRHLQVIHALAKKQSGLTRQEIVRASDLPTGGSMSTILSELEASGFICRTVPFERARRDTLYRLIDEFTLFYLRWLRANRNRTDSEGQWMHTRSTPAWHAWSGYAFENICLRHVPQIKKALGISGLKTEHSSWRHHPDTPAKAGAQIDLVIDRRDGVINLCEMKFSDSEFIIDKKYAGELLNKRDTFRSVTGTRKTLFLTLITAHGVKPGTWKADLVQNELVAGALFEP